MVFAQGSVAGIDTACTFSPDRFNSSDRVSLRGECDIPQDALVLGFVGRLVKDKGLRELACAWETLRSEYPWLYLLLVGPFEKGDPLLPRDEVLIRSDPRVRLVGFANDTVPFYAIMDVFVLPSYREGFGLTNIEAAAMQLPVVSTRIPGCVDSVQDGVTGELVPPRDAESLAEAIRKYLDDESLRHRHGLAGRERVIREFRPEPIWEDLCQEYARLLQERGILFYERSPNEATR
jgi:glycosyltransferase involved in cell wall biosynthesis